MNGDGLGKELFIGVITDCGLVESTLVWTQLDLD